MTVAQICRMTAPDTPAPAGVSVRSPLARRPPWVCAAGPAIAGRPLSRAPARAKSAKGHGPPSVIGLKAIMWARFRHVHEDEPRCVKIKTFW